MEAIKKFFFIDGKTGLISHTKFYSNLGYLAIIGTYIYAVVADQNIDPTLMMMFGGIIIGNRSILKVAHTLGIKKETK